MSHTRQRAEDTPSHPGGLSEEGRVLLEAHRRRRDHQRGAFALSPYSYPSSHPLQREFQHIKKRKQTARAASMILSAVPTGTAIALGGGKSIHEVGK
jgi:hypothetical protein